MQVNPYLSFDGRCEEAFKFYEQHLGGKLLAKFTYSGSPMEGQFPAGWGEKIMHAALSLDNNILMGSDVTPDRYHIPKGTSLSISVNDPAEAERVFQALAQNGSVEMPIQETFWAVRFGMLRDQFGIPWMINCEQPR